MNKLKDSLLGVSFLQAASTSLVIWLWSIVMMNGERWFDTGTQPNPISFIMIPIAFIIVATLSGGAVLAYPLYLAFQSKWKKAGSLILLTLLWLAIFSIILISIY